MLASLGWRVQDIPDLDFDWNKSSTTSTASTLQPIHARNAIQVGQATHQLAQLVKKTKEAGHFPLILGGDHSIGIGSLAGLLSVNPDLGVIWVDAHADLHTPLTSSSGNMHGMPIGMLMNQLTPHSLASSPMTIPGFDWLADPSQPLLQPEQVIYVGLRDVDAAERQAIRQLGITAYTMHEIDKYGIGTVMELALTQLLKDHPNRPLHVSYDIDAVDPVLAPATGTTVRGGLTYREAHYVAEAVAVSGNLTSAEIVELNPSLADNQSGADETVELGLQIVTSLMGKSII